jgi:hypothetical protein
MWQNQDTDTCATLWLCWAVLLTGCGLSALGHCVGISWGCCGQRWTCCIGFHSRG